MVIRVSDALAVDSIVVRTTSGSFAHTITALVNLLVAAGRLPACQAEEAVRRVFAREATDTTAMVDIGVSIPHARLEGIPGIAAALAVSPQAVYQVTDGLPISIVALVLSSPEESGKHLSLLSQLSMLLQSPRMRQRLRNAASAEELSQLIRQAERGRG